MQNPLGLIKLMSRVFSRLDFLAEQNGVDRIKVQGAAFTVVSGLGSEENKWHAQAMARFATQVIKSFEDDPIFYGVKKRKSLFEGGWVEPVRDTLLQQGGDHSTTEAVLAGRSSIEQSVAASDTTPSRLMRTNKSASGGIPRFSSGEREIVMDHEGGGINGLVSSGLEKGEEEVVSDLEQAKRLVRKTIAALAEDSAAGSFKRSSLPTSLPTGGDHQHGAGGAPRSTSRPRVSSSPRMTCCPPTPPPSSVGALGGGDPGPPHCSAGVTDVHSRSRTITDSSLTAAVLRPAATEEPDVLAEVDEDHDPLLSAGEGPPRPLVGAEKGPRPSFGSKSCSTTIGIAERIDKTVWRDLLSMISENKLTELVPSQWRAHSAPMTSAAKRKRQFVKVRIGIHSPDRLYGSLVGLTTVSYDVWGDAVTHVFFRVYSPQELHLFTLGTRISQQNGP